MIEIVEAVNSAIETVKRLSALNEKIKDADVKMLIADLNIELANAKNNIAELLTENQRLKDEIKKLNKKRMEKLQFKGGAYYSSTGDGPFCQRCYDSKQLKNRLVENNPDFKFIGNYKCSICNNMFKVTEQ
ncbi:MAG: hypothetical protein LBN27_06120 [Prevotellaceae bacterium]|nr:hypothetical protein [Prevotellaceae bacterium]